MSTRRVPVQVYKFGGVAVGTADAIRVAVDHVTQAEGALVVVVSAMNGITDLLLDTAKAALRRDESRFSEAARKFAARHLDLVPLLFTDASRADGVRTRILASTEELLSMAASIAVLRELTPRAQDSLLARGERLLASIFDDYLRERGVASAFIEAAEIIITERRVGSLWPSLSRCERAADTHVRPLLAAGKVVIVPGFIGRGPDGEVVTLGRGGSDFSAAILARSLGATSLTLFKEVDGLLTADPRLVPDARVLTQLHYREAAELAYYGAKVLHPRTMIPLTPAKIPLLLRNTFHAERPGTRIAGDVDPGAYPVRALTAIHRQALVAIEGNGMLGVPGVAARAFAALSSAGHSVSMISQASSESSICIVLPASESAHAVRALQSAFEQERRARLIDRIGVTDNIALVAVVGLGMRGVPGIAARTFTALSAAAINIIAIAQGSSELNITVAVSESDATAALRALHTEYQLDKSHPLPESVQREAKLTLLGFGQIGRALVGQLVAQQGHIHNELGADVRCVAIADRSGIRIEEKGFTAAALRKLAKQKATGTRLFERSAPLTIEQLRSLMREELWLLPSHRPVLVDLTSEETAPLLQEALEQGFHVVLANKKPLAVPQADYDRMMETARDRGLALRYEATAGAGLPVLDTLAKLRQAGDRVETIVGCFSGTLGYLMTAVEDGSSFSAAVREAWRLGYTEPDPRDDLSGMDVARKALILARTLGLRANIEDIALEPLFGADVDSSDPKTFVTNLATLDAEFARRAALAGRTGKVLRYVARIDGKRIRVGIEAVPVASPMGRLRGTDNQVAIYSKRYKTNPLVITGPGAGADVTAAGVLNDIVAIAVEEKRRRFAAPPATVAKRSRNRP